MSFKKLKKQTSIYREKIGMAIIVLEQAISNIIKSIETSSKVCRGRLAPQWPHLYKVLVYQTNNCNLLQLKNNNNLIHK